MRRGGERRAAVPRGDRDQVSGRRGYPEIASQIQRHPGRPGAWLLAGLQSKRDPLYPLLRTGGPEPDLDGLRQCPGIRRGQILEHHLNRDRFLRFRLTEHRESGRDSRQGR